METKAREVRMAETERRRKEERRERYARRERDKERKKKKTKGSSMIDIKKVAEGWKI